jgi:hypothetical protein
MLVDSFNGVTDVGKFEIYAFERKCPTECTRNHGIHLGRVRRTHKAHAHGYGVLRRLSVCFLKLLQRDRCRTFGAHLVQLLAPGC